MFCPKCRGEFIEGITECPDCKVDLTEELNPEDDYEYEEFVTVYSTSDPTIIVLAQSILNSSGIQYAIKSEGLQTIMGIGVVQFQVETKNKEATYELLKDLMASGDETTPDNEESE